MNDAPAQHVKNVVTARILEMDKRSCDNLLNAIILDKKEEDKKNQTIQRERLASRNRLMTKHNDRLAHADQLGVKIREPVEDYTMSMDGLKGLTKSKKVGDLSFI